MGTIVSSTVASGNDDTWTDHAPAAQLTGEATTVLSFGRNSDPKGSGNRYAAYMLFRDLNIPVGSTILRAKLTVTWATTVSTSFQRFSVALVNRDGAWNADDFQEDVFFKEGQPRLRVEDSSVALADLSPGSGADTVINLFDIPAAPADNLGVRFKPTASGSIDTATFRLARTGDLGIHTCVAEIFTASDDVLIGSSTPRVVNSISNGAFADFSFNFPVTVPVVAGVEYVCHFRVSGPITTGNYISATGTLGAALEADVDAVDQQYLEYHNPIGESPGLYNSTYPLNAYFPGVKQATSDAFIAANTFASSADPGFVPHKTPYVAGETYSWGDAGFTPEVDVEMGAFTTDFFTMIQAWIDDPNYDPTEPIVVALTAGYLAAPAADSFDIAAFEHATYAPAVLTVEYDPPADLWTPCDSNPSTPHTACDADPATPYTACDADPSTAHTAEDANPSTSWTAEDANPSTTWTKTDTNPS